MTKPLYKVEWILAFVVLFLIGIGIIFIYSSTYGQAESEGISLYAKQILALIPGFLLFALFFFWNYQKLKNWSFLFYSVALGLLVLLIFFGQEKHGARSWFSIFGVSFQPSEPAKLFLIFALARYLDRSIDSIEKLSVFLKALLFPLPILILVLIQPDPGTALVYLPVTLAMLFMAGARLRYILVILVVGFLTLSLLFYSSYQLQKGQDLIREDQTKVLFEENWLLSQALSKQEKKDISTPLVQKDPLALNQAIDQKIQMIKNSVVLWAGKISLFVLGGTLLFFALFQVFRLTLFRWVSLLGITLILSTGMFMVGQFFLKDYHRDRLLSFLDLEKDPKGAGYNQRQSIIAIGSGGFTGHGLLAGPQSRLNYIPESSTDFIFAVIGEEGGFFTGTIPLFLMFVLLLYRSMMIALDSKDYYGSLMATGIATLFFMHIFINPSVAVGLLPVMGLPLPFISAGGSFLLTNLMAVALLFNISQRRFIH